MSILYIVTAIGTFSQVKIQLLYFLEHPTAESSLLSVLADHLNAEVVAGTIQSRQDALDYMTWTYFFRRLLQNPSYYGLELEEGEEADLNRFLSSVVGRALDQLELSYCLEFDEDGRGVYTTVLGRIASYYYLHHSTVQLFSDKLHGEVSVEELLKVLSDSTEFAELPVRHNEEHLNADLAKLCPFPVNQYTLDSAHKKMMLLLKAHLSRLPLPFSDYLTDTKGVLDNGARVLQAMLDVTAESGWLASSLRLVQTLQMLMQARWDTDSPFLQLPNIEQHMLYLFKKSLPELIRQE